MKDWKGCRGLDPAVALAVDNAMPPYLIWMESTGVEPFSASRQGASNTCSGNAPSFPNCYGKMQATPFEQLTEHLVRFVRERQVAGAIITDESIQQEARCLIYGDDDPWNQTAADNPEWLRLFKEGLSLNLSTSTVGAEESNTSNAIFPLPWTLNSTGQKMQETEGLCNPDLAPRVDPWMPWAWQSPECLVEFRRFNQESGSYIVQQGNGACSRQPSSNSNCQN
jgi:hypothetical protein